MVKNRNKRNRQGGCPCCPADNTAASIQTAIAKTNESNQKSMAQMKAESDIKVATANKPTIVKKSVVGEVFDGVGGIFKTAVGGALAGTSAIAQAATGIAGGIFQNFSNIGSSFSPFRNATINQDLEDYINQNVLVINHPIPQQIVQSYDRRRYKELLKQKILACNYIIQAIASYIIQDDGWEDYSEAQKQDSINYYMEYNNSVIKMRNELQIILNAL